MAPGDDAVRAASAGRRVAASLRRGSAEAARPVELVPAAPTAGRHRRPRRDPAPARAAPRSMAPRAGRRVGHAARRRRAPCALVCRPPARAESSGCGPAAPRWQAGGTPSPSASTGWVARDDVGTVGWAQQGSNLRLHPCEGCTLPLSYAPARARSGRRGRGAGRHRAKPGAASSASPFATQASVAPARSRTQGCYTLTPAWRNLKAGPHPAKQAAPTGAIASRGSSSFRWRSSRRCPSPGGPRSSRHPS